MYIYFNVNFPPWKKEKIPWHQKVISIIAELFLPKANPDFDKAYDSVVSWSLELSDDGNFVNREIGYNNLKEPIVIAPFRRNLGFWVDSDMSFNDFKKRFDIRFNSQQEFDLEWKKADEKLRGTQ